MDNIPEYRAQREAEEDEAWIWFKSVAPWAAAVAGFLVLIAYCLRS